jgi:diguanylate cyclase (GGDEF)-like protein
MRRFVGVGTGHSDSFPLRPPPVRVLAVDDDAGSLELIRAVLGSLAKVTTVESGESALEALKQGGYAVVLLDVGLPGIDGFETARLMKERPSTRHTPVIFLTGQIGDEQVRRGYELGAADYLLKPFDPEILRAKVRVFVELAELRREAEVLSHRVLHDQLTGLPNRALFIDRLEHALARLSRKPGLVAVLFLDLDGFKLINDGIGHDAGDRLLIEVAARLESSIRSSDTAARFAGDEFLVLLEGLADEQEIERLSTRITGTLGTPYRIGSNEVFVSAAIGVAITDDSSADPASLIQAADESMLRAKGSTARSRPGIHDGEMAPPARSADPSALVLGAEARGEAPPACDGAYSTVRPEARRAVSDG